MNSPVFFWFCRPQRCSRIESGSTLIAPVKAASSAQSVGDHEQHDMSVAETQPAVPKSRIRWYQYSLRSLLIATAVLAFMLGMVVHFRTHLYLRYVMASDGKFATVKAIPASPMPDAPTPKDWVLCRFGLLEFYLPPAMAGNIVTPKNGARLRSFHDGPRSVIVEMPEGTADTETFLQTELKLPPQGKGMSRQRLRLAWCQVNATDFRWTMSQDEVRWHAWCVAMSILCQVEPDGSAETMFGADLDGILLIRQSRNHACFDWQANKKAIGGYINFKDDSTDPDADWMRCVCKSVQVCDEPQSGQPPDKK
jgi:hypothetical protein